MKALRDNCLMGSHLPLLIRAVENSTGPILEVGGGDFSTPMLDMLCRKEKRLFITFETFLSWYEKLKGYKSDYHKIIHIDNCQEIHTHPVIANQPWGVVFIDQKPAYSRRFSAQYFADKAKYVILHDSEPEQENHYKYNRIYSQFKYRYNYTAIVPHTTVLSNFEDVSETLSNNFTEPV